MESFVNWCFDHPEVIISFISFISSIFTLIFSSIKLSNKRICKICNKEIDNLSELIKHKLYCELLQQGGEKVEDKKTQ